MGPTVPGPTVQLHVGYQLLPTGIDGYLGTRNGHCPKARNNHHRTNQPPKGRLFHLCLNKKHPGKITDQNLPLGWDWGDFVWLIDLKSWTVWSWSHERPFKIHRFFFLVFLAVKTQTYLNKNQVKMGELILQIPGWKNPFLYPKYIFENQFFWKEKQRETRVSFNYNLCFSWVV